MNAPSDTIAAVATAPGPAGIAIIRVSGPDSLQVADRIFSCVGPAPSRRPASSFVHGFVKSNRRTIDEAILLIMRAPHSYTREDAVEIQGHGGSQSARRILAAALEAGARPAEPGEFTKRAFLHGRIDLVQAEAVLDLINAQSERSAAAAVEQLEGRLSVSFHDLYDRMMRACADLEAALDFSEDETSPELIPDVIRQLDAVRDRIHAMLETAQEGHLLREGASVVITGQPNVGKSSVFNALLGKHRAIVSPIPGTTRDTIEETVLMQGVPIRLIDTAGLRASACDIEQEGVRRARLHIKTADLCLYVLDASNTLFDSDLQNILSFDRTKTLVVFNKTDLGCRITPSAIPSHRSVLSEAINNKGVKDIIDTIVDMIGLAAINETHAAISSRHVNILRSTLTDVNESISMLVLLHENDFVPVISTLRVALESIGKLTGKTFHEELLNTIFSRFCVGK